MRLWGRPAGTVALLAALVAGTPLRQAVRREEAQDGRAWQHGIDIVHVGRRYAVIWSSWGNPPAPVPDADHWQHDVYYSWLDPLKPGLDPHTLVSLPEAQEPASSAANSAGHVLVTCEDGHDPTRVLDQNAGLFDGAMSPLHDYPMMVGPGGHSGHVAALGSDFLVTYGREWVDGGGVNGLGTGRDVLARVVHDDGYVGPEIPVSVNPEAQLREWWPVAAASDRNWLVVWQRYGGEPGDYGGQLWGAIVNPAGDIVRKVLLTDDIDYYHYNVQYARSIHRYVVFGSRRTGGYVLLVDPEGSVVAERMDGLAPTVRESKMALREEPRARRTVAVYAARPTGVVEMTLTPNGLASTRVVADPYAWQSMGTDGMFVTRNKVLFATLSRKGVQFVSLWLGK